MQPGGIDMTTRVSCLGGAVLDLIYGVDALPSEDGKSVARSFMESGGGMAANAAVIVSRLGGAATWCGRIGDDDKGLRILNGLRQENVDVSTVLIIPGMHSAHSVVLKDRIGNRAIILFKPEKVDPDPSWLPLDRLLDADAVVADNRWIEGAAVLLAAARDKGLPAILDADAAGDLTTLEAVKVASHVIFSAPGLASLFATEDIEAALRAAQDLAPFVAVTRGRKGVHWLDENARLRHLPAFAVDAVETVGAGDIFHGSFAYALGSGMPIEAALRFSSAASALKCTGEGGRKSYPNGTMVRDFLADMPEARTVQS